jgi:hypothetical protein
VERSAGRRFRTQLFFDEWIHGTTSSELLLQDDIAVEEIARRYRR